ncbi:hypothetical protein S83_062664 [Arachis hypogaea]
MALTGAPQLSRGLLSSPSLTHVRFLSASDLILEEEFSVEIPDEKTDKLARCANVAKYIASGSAKWKLGWILHSSTSLCVEGWREEMVLGIGWTTTLFYRDGEEKVLLLSLGIGVNCLLCLQACVSVYLLWGASCLTQK